MSFASGPENPTSPENSASSTGLFHDALGNALPEIVLDLLKDLIVLFRQEAPDGSLAGCSAPTVRVGMHSSREKLKATFEKNKRRERQ